MTNKQKYKGLVLLGDRHAEVREFPYSEPKTGEILIQMKAAGICGSDLHFYRNTPEELGIRRAVVIGHEPSGIVEKVGPGVSFFRPGDRIAVNHTLGCNHCEYCLAGETALCSENVGIAAAGFGGDAEYALMPANTCFHLSQELSFIEGTFIACTGATVYNALRKLRPSGRDKLVVFGLGPVGLSAVLVGKALGATIFGVDVIPERLEMAKMLGVSEVINASETNTIEAVQSLTEGKGVELALETSGSLVAQSDAVDILRPQGKVAFLGMGKGGKSISPEQFMHKQAILIGSKVMPGNLYWEMTRFLIEQKIRFESLITHRATLDEGPAAFKKFDSGAAGKFVFIMD
jgi:threonine dehydrogenase-like Zn-dependent dehydrogenase